MSTEWLQIVLTVVIVLPLIVLTGRYLYWRQWDRERRAERLNRLHILRLMQNTEPRNDYQVFS